MTAERFMLGVMIITTLVIIGLRQTRKALFNAFKPKPQCPAYRTRRSLRGGMGLVTHTADYHGHDAHGTHRTRLGQGTGRL